MDMSAAELLAALQEQQSQNRAQWNLLAIVAIGMLTFLYTGQQPAHQTAWILASIFIVFSISNGHGLVEGTSVENALLTDLTSKEIAGQLPESTRQLFKDYGLRPRWVVITLHSIADLIIAFLIVRSTLR